MDIPMSLDREDYALYYRAFYRNRLFEIVFTLSSIRSLRA
jgi:hypothetical protein